MTTAMKLPRLCNEYLDSLATLQELAENSPLGQVFLTELVDTSEKCLTQFTEAINKVNRAIEWFRSSQHTKKNELSVGQHVNPRQLEPQQPQLGQPQGASAVDIQDTAQRNRKAMVATAESAEEIVQSIPEVIFVFLQINVQRN